MKEAWLKLIREIRIWGREKREDIWGKEGGRKKKKKNLKERMGMSKKVWKR